MDSRLDYPKGKTAQCYALSGPSLLHESGTSLPLLKVCTKFQLELYLNERSNKLHLPRPQTNFYHSSFVFQGTMHFNNLPEYRISESLRAVNNLRLPYFSIVIIIIHSCFLCFFLIACLFVVV